MSTLREKYKDLELEVANNFSELLQERTNDMVFLSDDDDYSDNEIVDVIDDVNGGIYSTYVCGISKEGMIQTRTLVDGNKAEVRLSDLADVLDRINIVEILTL